MSLLSLVLFVALASPDTVLSTYQGYGTVYSLSTPSSGNCNFMHWPSEAVTKYAALNAAQWNETMNCGRCAQVSCTDPSCSGMPSEIVYILDQCPGCAYGDLDLSPEMFESITGQSYTKLSIEWNFVECPVSNNVQYCLKTGSSEFWVAVQPANFISGVQSMTINHQEASLVDSAYYFLIDGKGKSVADLHSMQISITGVNGEVLEETLSMAADSCTNGHSQFSSSSSVYQSTSTSTSTSFSSFSSSESTSTQVSQTIQDPSNTEVPVTDPPLPSASPIETPTMSPPTESPSSIPPTESPSIPPVTQQTEAPTTSPMTESPSIVPPTEAPLTPPMTEAPSGAPTTEAPSTNLLTDAPPSPRATQIETTPLITDISTTIPPTDAPASPATEMPSSAPITEAPTTAPLTEPPTEAPTSPSVTEMPSSAPPIEALTVAPMATPSTYLPTGALTSPSTEVSWSAPLTEAPTVALLTEMPTQATISPSLTEELSSAPLSEAPTMDPTKLPIQASNSSPATEGPSIEPLLDAPTVASFMELPTQAATSPPVTEAPSSAPQIEAPTTVPSKDSPTQAPATSPETQPLSSPPSIDVLTLSSPTLSPLFVTPATSSPIVSPSASPRPLPSNRVPITSPPSSAIPITSTSDFTALKKQRNFSRSTLKPTRHWFRTYFRTNTSKPPKVSLTPVALIPSNKKKESGFKPIDQKSTKSVQQEALSQSQTTVEPSGNSATSLSMQSQEKSSKSVHWTAAFIVFGCLALGAIVRAVVMTVRRKREFEHERKDTEESVSYLHICTPRSEAMMRNTYV
ncbi:uncharacterized protein CCR75_005084 [Bremia lactucae]|uniref:Expansin-like EG45 domain-containing protein n=1 Tax=Bremia lactucae TaxID=4779 RepID=A0A976IMA4_BRELC|nr:hypothetical protein CCR75_005084 [Bremia lactucae]